MCVGAEAQTLEIEVHGSCHRAAKNARLEVGHVQALAIRVIGATRGDAPGVEPLEVKRNLLRGVAAVERQLAAREAAMAQKIRVPKRNAAIPQDGAQILKIQVAAIHPLVVKLMETSGMPHVHEHEEKEKK